MQAIRTKNKVTANLLTGEKHHIVFKDIVVTYNTSVDYVLVSINLYKEILHDFEVEGKIYQQPELVLLPELKLADGYPKDMANKLVEDVLKTKPKKITTWTETNQFIYLYTAMGIIADKGYLGLKPENLEVI